MGPERKLYQDLKKNTCSILWNRVENISLLGMPDVLGYELEYNSPLLMVTLVVIGVSPSMYLSSIVHSLSVLVPFSKSSDQTTELGWAVSAFRMRRPPTESVLKKSEDMNRLSNTAKKSVWYL